MAKSQVLVTFPRDDVTNAAVGCVVLKIKYLGCRLAHLVSQVSHVLRLCSGPGFDSRPGSLCCVSLPLCHPVSCHYFQLYSQ